MKYWRIQEKPNIPSYPWIYGNSYEKGKIYVVNFFLLGLKLNNTFLSPNSVTKIKQSNIRVFYSLPQSPFSVTSLSIFVAWMKGQIFRGAKKSLAKVSNSAIYRFLNIPLVKPTFSFWLSLHTRQVRICFLPTGKPIFFVVCVTISAIKIMHGHCMNKKKTFFEFQKINFILIFSQFLSFAYLNSVISCFITRRNTQYMLSCF